MVGSPAENLPSSEQAELQRLRQRVKVLEAENLAYRHTQVTLEDTIRFHQDCINRSITGFFQCTPDGHFRLANQAYVQMLGFTTEAELIAAFPDIAAVYINADRWHNLQQQLDECDRVTSVESQIRHTDGSTRWVLETVWMVCDAGGKPVYYAGSSLDITAHKRAEETLQQAKAKLEQDVKERTAALRESNDYLIAEIAERKQIEIALRESRHLMRTVFDSIPAMISAKDRASRYLFVNSYKARIYGLHPREAVHKTTAELLGSEEQANYVRSLDEQVLNSGQAIPLYEEEFADHEGVVHTWLTTKVPLQNELDGECYGVATISLDVSDRKQAEAALSMTQNQFQTILETIPGIVSWISTDLKYRGVNRQLASMYGLDPEDFVGQDIGFLNASSEFEDFVREFFQSNSQESFREFSANVSGEPRTFLIMVQKYEAGQAAFAVGIDVTERRQAESELRTTKDQLQAALDAVPGIVSWISSDLRYLGVNRHLAQLFNLPPEAFVGKDIGFLHTGNSFSEFLRSVFDNPQPDAHREIVANINGAQRDFLIMAQKYNHDRAVFTVGIDITEQKQARRALEEAERKYRSIFERVVEGIFQSTVDGQYLNANPALARIYGYDSPEDLKTGLTSIQKQLYVHPQRRDEFIQALTNKDEVIGFESEVYRKDGRPIWISENARAVRDEQDNLLYFEGTVEDITERKQAVEALKRVKQELETKVEERTQSLRDINHRLLSEITERRRIEEALRHSEAELRALFAAMTDYIAVFDAQGCYCKIVSTNSELQYDPDRERIGKTVYDILPPEQAALFIIHIQRALNTGETINLEYSMPVHDGEANGDRDSDVTGDREAWFTASVSPMPDNRVIWVARDITQRKRAESALRQAEEKYRSIFENAAEGIFQTTPEGRCISVNPALATMYGYDSPQALLDDLLDVVQLHISPARRQEFVSLIERYGAVTNFESQIRRKDGKIIWISENARAVRDGMGAVRYYEGTVQDITTRKLAEMALKAEQDKSERLLLNILPKAIAQQLKQNSQAIANRFDEATILFADIVDFTSLAARISPTELVDLLNLIFSSFDQLADRHGLEKIKTIGDAYMVVGGLPTPRPDHIQAIAELALDMQAQIATFKRDTGDPFQIRIGINTGPVVAGVIGIRKFIYDLWGDTVNVASRMESRGVAGNIQVTEPVYEALKDRYLLQKRGTVHIKGKGDVMAYWLKDRLYPPDRFRL
ncbi:MAG: PAS domain S-box protein [Synechococcales bacterium]|nr:PAS domain S-box protein [Synechococcales bacterium]